MEAKKTEMIATQMDCYTCHLTLGVEREHLFHYIMGVAWYDRATYEQVEKLISCYAQMYPNQSAEVEMLRTINEIERKRSEENV